MGGDPNGNSDNSNAMFEFDSSSLSSFALGKNGGGGQSSHNKKQLLRGGGPPTSGTAALQRSPERVYQDTTKAMATKDDDGGEGGGGGSNNGNAGEPGSPPLSPVGGGRPKTALTRVLLDSGGIQAGVQPLLGDHAPPTNSTRRRLSLTHLPPPPAAAGAGNESSNTNSKNQNQCGGSKSGPNSPKSPSNLEAFLNMDDKVTPCEQGDTHTPSRK